MRGLSKSAAALAAVALLLAGGGTYALASSAASTITVCVKHKGGALYKAKKCAKHDGKLSWNKQGPAGNSGSQGPKGNTGPQGPGATTIATTLPLGTSLTTIATLPNGTLLMGGCSDGKVDVGVEHSSSQTGLQVSGTSSNDSEAPTEASEDQSILGLNTGPGGNTSTDISQIHGTGLNNKSQTRE